jgi:hypothetical protein
LQKIVQEEALYKTTKKMSLVKFFRAGQQCRSIRVVVSLGATVPLYQGSNIALQKFVKMLSNFVDNKQAKKVNIEV